MRALTENHRSHPTPYVISPDLRAKLGKIVNRRYSGIIPESPLDVLSPIVYKFYIGYINHKRRPRMETMKEKKVKYHVMIRPSLRRELRQAAAAKDVSISAMLDNCVVVGLKHFNGKPPRPAA
jgi:hypothetical protein